VLAQEGAGDCAGGGLLTQPRLADLEQIGGLLRGVEQGPSGMPAGPAGVGCWCSGAGLGRRARRGLLDWNGTVDSFGVWAGPGRPCDG
jgi:hypothetical protein